MTTATIYTATDRVPLSEAALLERRTLTERILHRNVLWALGAGVLPLPLFDVVAITGVQMKMLKELSEVYNIPFKEGLVKKLVGSLLIGLGGVGVGWLIGASLFKLVPGIGSALGGAAVPATSGAITHAVGRVFIMHFESGGTFLDFDPHRMREYFRVEFDAAKEKIAHMHDPPTTVTASSVTVTPTPTPPPPSPPPFRSP